MKTPLLFATALCATAAWATDFQLAVPDTGDAPPQGGEAAFDVEATEGLDWDVSQVTDNWLVVKDTAGTGAGSVTYQAEANPSTAPRSAKIRLSAHLPEPEVDLSRGLLIWNDAQDTIFNQEWILGREWKTDSAESFRIIFHTLDTFRPVCDFYGGIGSLYVTEENQFIFQWRDNEPITLPYTFEAEKEYKIFFVRDLTGTDIYIGAIGEGQTTHLLRTETLDPSSPGSIIKPIEATLAESDGSTRGGDYWDRTISKAEVDAALSHGDSRPWATKDTTQAPYTDLAEFYSLDSWARIQIYYDHNNHLSYDRFGWECGAYGGGLRSWDINAVDAWWKETNEVEVDVDVSDLGSAGSALSAIRNGERLAREAAEKEIGTYLENRATSATYSFWCRWNRFVPGTIFSYYAYKRNYEVEGGYAYVPGGGYRTNWAYYTLLPLAKNPPVTSCVTLDEGGHLGLFDTFTEVACELNRWHMVTVSIDENSYTLYLDGEQILTTTGATFDTAYPEFWELGGGRTVEYIYDRVIPETYDDLSHFKKALTAEEVKALYETEKPLEAVYTVNQAPQETEMRGETTQILPCEGAAFTVEVSAGTDQQWDVQSNADWVLASTATGQGSATVLFSVQPNPSIEERTTTVTVAGREITVTQRGYEAVVTPNVPMTVPLRSAMRVFTVTIPSYIAWEATSNADWIKIESGATGMGNGTVQIITDTVTDAPNGYSRMGTLTIAGQTVYVIQRNFDLSLSPLTATYKSAGGSGEIDVNVADGIPWTIDATADWVKVTSEPGTGHGTVTYTVEPNKTGEARSAFIIVSGSYHTVTQNAESVVAVETVGEGSVSGGGTVPDDTEVTLTATPAEGYVFSHWTGDAEGTVNPLTFTAEGTMSVVAHFVPQAAVDAQVEAAIEAGGYVTKEQVKDLSFGAPKPDAAETDADGVISVTLPREGNAAFYRFLSPEPEEEETPAGTEP